MTRLMSLVAALMLALPVYAAEMGDDGLHKADWMRETFKDLNEDLAEANAEGKRLMLLFEQRGCVYCRKMHEEVFSDAEVADYIRDNYFVVQMNLHGDTEIVDFDGEAMTEKAAARKWGLLFTPTILYLPEEVEEGKNAAQAAVASQPGAFSKGTTLDLMTWVEEKRYELDNGEDFQRYHARRIKERDDGKTD
ncbi:thioredoxin family protein [Roseovarius indicus]|uniref:Thiol:disulfide interchange protein n=1 Tax=Roseovarius indicus TaxID=540747 RepID=A0A0T5PD55_9RHOB|nr:thioredoxin family protein [Roseovarius indicus]KRS19053.1 thioredoxin [Roseovarius indicus]QEW26003.1 thiol:disulfide interchange protein precursor [Roseovarius indicus]SFD91718.1 Thioredoxin-related protein [Roseovarius indicus]